jgi:cytochrome c biogenesis protein CcmG/thiol:disulfide interchange protein DsbE
VVLVNVFASWCEPCQTEAPAIERAQHLLAAHGGTVLGVSYQDNASADTSFVHQYGWSFPVVQDPSGDFAHAFGVTGVPENFVVNAQGKVTALFRGPVSSSWIQQALHRALAQPA